MLSVSRPHRTDHAIRNRWSRLQSILGLNDAGGSGPAGEAGAAAARLHDQQVRSLSRSDSDPGGRSDLGGPPSLVWVTDVGGRPGIGGSLGSTPRTKPLSPPLNVSNLSLAKHVSPPGAGPAAEAMPGASRAAGVSLPQQNWPQQSSDAAPPPTSVLDNVQRGTNAPPSSPQLAPAAGHGAFSLPTTGAFTGDRYGGGAFELLHKLGSHNASAHASPALGPSQGAALPLPGSEQLAALPPGALPEGSAELLLLKKARVT